MLRVGLTGGMACGKSTVAKMFASRGAHVLDADKVVHQLMLPGTSCYDAVVRTFGAGVLAQEGTIDRALLAQAAFPDRIQELTNILHPAVLEYQRKWMSEVGKRDATAIAMVEAALLLEAGARADFDKIVVVACSPEQKIERLAQRLQLDREAAELELERRTAAQWADERKAGCADFLIDNSGPLQETERQVDELSRALKRFAGQNV